MHRSQIQLMIAYFTLAVSIIVFFWFFTNFDIVMGWIGWIFNVLGPFIWGFILAYLLSIPCRGMQNLLDKFKLNIDPRIKKVISVIIVYLLFFFVIYSSIILLAPRIIYALTDLVASIPLYYHQLSYAIDNINQSGELPFLINLQDIIDDLWDSGFQLSNPLSGMMNYDAIMGYVGTILGGASHLFRGFLAFISSIYFLFESEKLGLYIKRVMSVFMSPRSGSIVLDYGRRINQYFKKYIFCLIMDCVAMTIVGYFLLTVIGSPYALFLGLLLGVMNFIPYFGSIVATIIAIIVVTFTQGTTMGIISTVILLITQQLDANVLQPRLYGTSLKLSPLLVIVSVTVGGAIGGVVGSSIGGTIAGMIVAIPCMKVIMNILDDVMEHHEKKHKAINLQ